MKKYYIPALGVVNIMSDATSILLPNTLNVVVTVTVGAEFFKISE